MTTPVSPGTCFTCGRPLQPGQPCATCQQRRAQNKSKGTVLIVVGAVLALAGGIPMAIGQEIGVFIGCFVLFVAGLGLAAYGRKVADRA